MSELVTKQHFVGSQRNVCIDMLKTLAVILITNSHLDSIYGSFSAIATGGAIGDALFFFCSGFTLFLGRTGRFDNYYRRRISRIYPSVIGWALITALLFNNECSFRNVVLYGGGSFVTAIMIYYIVLYIVKRYMIGKLNLAFCACCLYIILWYTFFFEPKEINHLYKEKFIPFAQYYHYIMFMLFGAVIGVRYNFDEKKRLGESTTYILKHILLLFLYIALFYGIQYAEMKVTFVAYIQIITLLPLLGIVWEFWIMMHSKVLLNLLYNQKVANSVSIISGLCLDIYITQMTLLGCYNVSLKSGGWATSVQSLFPVNIPIVICVILLSAYILRSVGRWFVQTFGKEDYNWNEILKLN